MKRPCCFDLLIQKLWEVDIKTSSTKWLTYIEIMHSTCELSKLSLIQNATSNPMDSDSSLLIVDFSHQTLLRSLWIDDVNRFKRQQPIFAKSRRAKSFCFILSFDLPRRTHKPRRPFWTSKSKTAFCSFFWSDLSQKKKMVKLSKSYVTIMNVSTNTVPLFSLF